ncbi:2TM domain-containing protein [Lacinutrix sp. Bg11-31]|uniref:2TM domain-containing protein n=1 Tax=Lacinutrix sp. Bg11-31 TaxID=2057808 RepID=UPI000C304E0C|nr:2TM domain-containing protein [Lacinutrix sp. Bg11-31]AUC80956.1 histidine kinase [Lacinutrix sp. Bg11-31]
MINFVKQFGKAFGIGIIVFLIICVFRHINGDTINLDKYLLEYFIHNQAYSVVLYLVNAYTLSYLTDRLGNKLFEFKNLVIAIILSIGVSILSVFCIRYFTQVIIYNSTFNDFLKTETLSNYQFALSISIFITVIFYSIYYYKSKQDRKVKEQKVIAGTASAKFDALKNQLDPHFLFNSLNVLTSLIEENPDNAQKFTTSLSKVYRYVLEQKNKDLITVDEELKFAKTYMSLLKMRFEDSIIFDIPEQVSNPESKVVPLSLQLLLENAVKHNVVTTSKPLHIKIYESDGDLIVENNLQTKQVIKKSSGVGLNNITQRYQLLTNRKVSIVEDKTHFTVAIPMLTKQVKVMRQIPEKQFDDRYVRARKRVEEQKEFYYNLISYCTVIPFLIFINYYTFWGFKWFLFPMFGWGLGLSIHAYKVFVNDGVLGRNWEQRKIEKFMKEEEDKRYS